MRVLSLATLRSLGCNLAACSLELSKDLSKADWRLIGTELASLRSTAAWWLGDWWAYGEHRYGVRREMVESPEWHGPSYQTCANAASVCRAFETSRRREVLLFSHHAEVASLDKADADALLDWAARPTARGRRARSVQALRDEKMRRSSGDVKSRAIRLVVTTTPLIPPIPPGAMVEGPVRTFPLYVPPEDKIEPASPTIVAAPAEAGELPDGSATVMAHLSPDLRKIRAAGKILETLEDLDLRREAYQAIQRWQRRLLHGSAAA